MRKKNPSEEPSIKSAFENMLQAYHLKDKYSEKTLISSWERLVGKTIASRTEKLFIKDKVLFVELNSAPLKHELSSSKEKVLEIFYNEYGKDVVTDIVFL